MIYVGIDIAKQTHYASIMTSDGEILAKPFDFFLLLLCTNRLMISIKSNENICKSNDSKQILKPWQQAYSGMVLKYYEDFQKTVFVILFNLDLFVKKYNV